MARSPQVWRWSVMVALVLVVGCVTAAPPAVEPQRLGPDQPVRFLLQGRVRAFVPAVPPAYRVRAIVAAAGTVTRVWFERYTRPGMQIAPGDSVTAWCRVVAGDTVADVVHGESQP